MHPLIKLYNKKEKLVIGLMSGTSMDGIDAALVRIRDSGENTKVQLIKFITFPYPNALRKTLLIISQPKSSSVEEICRLNVVVGEYFLDAIKKICDEAKINLRDIDLIGSHGQTIHHLPNEENCFGKLIRSTLQIGDPSLIASRTGVITVGNFRNADMAHGGQGAPLIPYFDYLLFRSSKYNRVLLNIGGIANVTILPRSCKKEDVVAFDTGPGNMIINRLMEKLYDQSYDANGEIALKGSFSITLLRQLLEYPYFYQAPPKSTGRKDFGDQFVQKILKKGVDLKLSEEDIIATATELTAYTIAEGIRFSNLSREEVDQLIVSGGGAHNRAIMRALKRLFSKSSVMTIDQFDMPGDAKEAICFAVLANETICGNKANIPKVTGAKKPAILGTIALA